MDNELSRRDFLKGSAAAVGSALLVSSGLAAGAFADEEAAAVELAPSDIPALVIDEFVCKPGEGKEFLEYYLEAYAPVAEAAGLTLKSKLVFPPCWLPEASNTIQVIWEMQGGNGFWGVYNRATRFDPNTIPFWADIRSRVISQDRRFFANVDEVEAMNNV